LLLLEDEGLALDDSVGVADELTDEEGLLPGEALDSGVPSGVVEAEAVGEAVALALVEAAAVAPGEAAALVAEDVPVL
jgi:hypothetical protein